MGGGDATTESQWLNWERKVADKYTRGLELPAARVRLRRPPMNSVAGEHYAPLISQTPALRP